MAKILETTDEQLLLDVKKVQDRLGNALDAAGNPRVAGKYVNGVWVALDKITLAQWTSIGLPADKWPPKWAGTNETFAVETDEADPSIKRLELSDDVVTKIDAAKAKAEIDCDTDEKILRRAAQVKDKPPKP